MADDTEYVPEGQAWQSAADLDLTTDDQVPAGHAVDAFKPSAPQYWPAGQSTQLLLLAAPVVARYVPAAHSVGAVVAGLGQ